MSTKRKLIRGGVASPALSERNLLEVVRLLKQNVDSMIGQLDPKARVLTVDDFGAQGISDLIASAGYIIGGGGGGIPGGGGGGDYDPTTDTTVPPAPTGLIVEGGYALMNLRWDPPPPTYRNPSYVEIWASADSLQANAALVGQSSSNFYVDPVGTGVTRYYWIRNVSLANISGPYNSPDGTSGSTAFDVAAALDALTGQITQSQLFADLGARINLIDGPGATPGTVNFRIAALGSDLTAAYAAADSGVLTSAQTYVQNYSYSKATVDGALTDQFNALTAAYQTGDADLTAYIQNYTYAKATTDAIASNVTTLISTVRNGGTGSILPATFEAGLSNWTLSRGGAPDAVASAPGTVITNDPDFGTCVEINYFDATGENICTKGVVPAIPGRIYKVTTRFKVTASDGTVSFSHIACGLTSSYSNSNSNFFSPSTVISGVNNVTEISHLISDVADVDAGVQAWPAGIAYIRFGLRLAAAEAGLVIRVQHITVEDVTDLEDVSAALQVEATTRATQTGDLYGKYGVKIDLNGYVSGFGLLAEANVDADPFSQFLIRADRFAVASPTGPGITPIVPFIVQTTSFTDGGVTRPAGVYIDAAYIKNLTAVYATIGSLIADQITAANINVSQLTAGTLRVGGYIQSQGFVSAPIGSVGQGWRINANGTAEFQAASIRGTLQANQIDSRGLSIYDNGGNLILSAGQSLNSQVSASAIGAVKTDLTNAPSGILNSSLVPSIAAAAVSAEWDSVTGIPYESIYSNDDAVALGFNPTFGAWSGTYPDGWSLYGNSGYIAKETSIKRAGPWAPRFNPPGGINTGLQRTSQFDQCPEGTFVAGSVDVYISSFTGAGKPGILVDLLYNGTTSYDRTIVAAELNTGAWQRLPFTARVAAGRRISGIRIYVMGSWVGMPGGNFQGTVIFDNLRFAFFSSELDNKSISISSNGSLTGAGGGQVTITGLGYIGDLNATRGAPSGTNVGSTSATTVESYAANGNAAYLAVTNASTGLAKKLAKDAADTLTGPINLNAATAILVGNTTTGLYLGNTGIVGRKNGATTFAVTAGGDASFAGQLNAATGSFVGSVAVNGATYANNVSGFWTGIDGGLAKLRVGDASQYLRWTGTNLEIKLNAITLSAGNFTNSSFPKSSTITRSLGSVTVTASGGTPPYTYNWSYTWNRSDGYTPTVFDKGSASFSGATANAFASANSDCNITVSCSCQVTDANGLSAVITRTGIGTFGSGPP